MHDTGGETDMTSTVHGHGAPVLPVAARVSLLGGFELCVNGENIELPHSAQRLISFLAVNRGALMRMFVAGSLWTGASEAKANSSLRSVLCRLRPRSAVIHATSTHLSLAPSVKTDLADWGDVVHRLRDDAVAPLPADVIALTDAGELLPDWYDDWLIVERERVRQRRVHSLEAVCMRLTEAGRYAEAIEAGLAAVAVEPLRESGHVAVMHVHLAEGNLVEASRQYEQLRDLLRENLGTQPSLHVHRLLRDAHVTAA
jgi:DNA-binding SARP family transcriptional activator